jgi:tetratricopeptide (TPR) repeat protein
MFLLAASVLAGTHRSLHFIIDSDLDPRYIAFIQANAEAYYQQMERLYFRTGGKKPLTIYYCLRQADTQILLKRHGLTGQIGYGRYVASEQAIYTHRLMNDGGGSGWGTLFHEITHHFIGLNFNNAPAWFEEGLACLLGEQTRIVKGKANIGHPNPWREYALREMIESPEKIDVKHLTSLTDRRFHMCNNNYHPARALFYWLHESGLLQEYLRNVQRKGYALSVLEETARKNYSQINAELMSFIKTNCYAGAYLYEGRQAREEVRKRQAFRKALELKPDYKAAKFDLARCCYRGDDVEKCRDYLRQILEDPAGIEYRGAARLMGNTYYRRKDYAEALKYYEKALDYSDHYEYKYELYYWMANCYHYLRDYASAEKSYKMFLDNNWEPQRLAKEVEYSKKYQKQAPSSKQK